MAEKIKPDGYDTALRREWVSLERAQRLVDEIEQLRERNIRLDALATQHLTQALTNGQAAQAAERKLAQLVNGWDRMFPMFDLEPESEFRRGQLCGWNQCISQVQELFDQAIGEGE